MDKFLQTNRNLWDGWTPIHAASPFFDVDAFRSGKNTLRALERDELGNISGKSILHLQCGLGLDSLSMVRMGANVTGVDFSGQSIGFARLLAQECQLKARFIEAELSLLDRTLSDQFDIAFTSYGVLHWLPDLTRWGQIIAHFLKPGGIFYMVEFHPVFNMFDPTGRSLVYPYFSDGKPVPTTKVGSCANPDATFEHPAFEWPHSLSDIIMALLDAGLRLRFFHEFPFMYANCLPYLTEKEPGQYHADPTKALGQFPLMFSLKAEAP